MSKPSKKTRPPKRVLALPDLEQSKTAVLNTLTSKSGQRSYDRAHCCPKQDRVVTSAVESEGLGNRESGFLDRGLSLPAVVPVQVMPIPG